MTGNEKYFNHLKENDMQFQIELGDDGQYAARGVVLSVFKGSKAILFISEMFSMFQD